MGNLRFNRFGSLVLLFGVVTLFAASIVGLALSISAMCRTLQQSVVFNFIILLPSLILSGLMTPVAAMPPWLQTATILNPCATASSRSHDLLRERERCGHCALPLADASHFRRHAPDERVALPSQGCLIGAAEERLREPQATIRKNPFGARQIASV